MSNINTKGGTELSVSIGIFFWRLFLPIAVLFSNGLPRILHLPNAVDEGMKRCRREFKPLGDITRIRFRVPQCGHCSSAWADLSCVEDANLCTPKLATGSTEYIGQSALIARYVRYRTDCGWIF